MQNLTNLDSDLGEASRKFLAGDFDGALSGFEELIVEGGDDLSPYFGAAHIYEHGLSSVGVNLSKADEYYSKIKDFDQSAGGEITLSLARVIYKSDDRQRASEIIRLCEDSLNVRPGFAAHMLIGTVLEYWEGEHKKARSHFLRAFKLGNSWGLKFYAKSLIRSKRYFLGGVMHIVSTFVGPFYFIRFGDRPMYG